MSDFKFFRKYKGKFDDTPEGHMGRRRLYHTREMYNDTFNRARATNDDMERWQLLSYFKEKESAQDTFTTSEKKLTFKEHMIKIWEASILGNILSAIKWLIKIIP